MRRSLLVPALLLGLGTTALLAQDGAPPTPPAPPTPAAPADPRLDPLVGTWVGRGTLWGQPTFEVWSVAWALEHQFLSVVSTRTVVGDDARSTSERQLFLRPARDPGVYRGAWLDTGGGLANVRAAWIKDAAGEGLLLELAPASTDVPKTTEPPAARWARSETGLDVRLQDAAGAEVGRLTLARKS